MVVRLILANAMKSAITMKKYKFLIDFFIGGSIFIISTILATFISLLFMGEGISTVIAFKGIEYISLFVLGGTIFTIMKYLFENITKKQNGKVMVLKSQIILYAILLVIAIFLLVFSIYKSMTILKMFSITFIFVLIIYELGLYLASKILIKDIEKINQKLKE